MINEYSGVVGIGRAYKNPLVGLAVRISQPGGSGLLVRWAVE